MPHAIPDEALSPEAERLLEEALQLKKDERHRLAEALVDSLDPATPEEIAAAWEDEIERRIDDLDAGRAVLVDCDAVLAEARERL